MKQISSRANYLAFLWHATLLAITATFIEINTVLPAMVIRVGGTELHIGIMTSIMIGVPMIAQLLFAGFLHSRQAKRPYLILGINLRILALASIAFTVMNISRFSLGVALALIYGELLLFTLSGAFAGVAYVDIIGKSFEPERRRTLFLNKQIISSIGILASALIVRLVFRRFGYPLDYFILYASAAAALLVASAGFYVLREPVLPAPSERRSYLSTLASIPERIRNDSNLRRYIVVANLVGIGVVLLPFYVAFAREKYTLDAGLVGNLLLLQIGGIVVSSLLWKRLARRWGFKGILYVLAALGALLPILALIVGTYLPVPAFLAVFFLSGAVVSAYKSTSEAVLAEISPNQDRALYAGIIGTLNLTVALMPIAAGALISVIGYVPLFIGASVLPVMAISFIRKMNCPVDRARAAGIRTDPVRSPWIVRARVDFEYGRDCAPDSARRSRRRPPGSR